MRIIAISDTHGKHNELSIPPGDVVIHAGDIGNTSTAKETFNFFHWFSTLPHKHKIFIAGNHDFFFEKTPILALKVLVPYNVIYLHDSGKIIDGVKFWGSPVTPWFHNWAFNRIRGRAILKHWDQIPMDTDVLITHGPAFGILDQMEDGENIGCKDLLETITKIKPKIHICGHIHEAYGQTTAGPTRFYNASMVNRKCNIANQPLVIDL
jgi:Icc-related predicted phosphoesterase